MIIKSIGIKRVFNHFSTFVNFSEGINLILGANGSGKTGLIECIGLGLFMTCEKEKKSLTPIVFQKGKETTWPSIKLETSSFTVFRSILQSHRDYFIIPGKEKIYGRENVTSTIQEILGYNKDFYLNIIYSSQESFLNFASLTSKERKRLLDKILDLEYIDLIASELVSIKNKLEGKKNEIVFFLKRLEASKSKRRQELINEINNLSEKLKEVEKEKERLEKEKLAIEAQKLLSEKTKWIHEYLKIKKEIEKVIEIEEKLQKIEQTKKETEEVLTKLKIHKQNLEEETKKIKTLLEKGICPFCKRTLQKTDVEKYEADLKQKLEKLMEIQTYLQDIQKKIRKLKSEEVTLRKALSTTNSKVLYQNLTKLKIKVLSTTPLKKLKDILKETKITEKEQIIYTKLEEVSKLVEEIKDKIKKLKWEKDSLEDKEKEKKLLQDKLEDLKIKIEKITQAKDILREEDFTGKIKKEILENIQTKSIFSLFGLGKLDFDENMEFYIDEIPLKMCSGSQKILVSLTIKLAFAKMKNADFIIIDEPTIFLDKKRIQEIITMLNIIKEKNLIKQIIVVSHEEAFKEIADKIIFVTKNSEGIAEVVESEACDY